MVPLSQRSEAEGAAAPCLRSKMGAKRRKHKKKGYLPMRLGLTEILLLAIIALLAFGPGVSRWMDRWSRRANVSRAEQARRRAAWEAERRARRELILRRFRIASWGFMAALALALVYTLGFRPIEAAPQSYTLPAAAAQTAARTVTGTSALSLEGYLPPDCMAVQDGWLYLAARPEEGAGSALLRMREDGSGLDLVFAEERPITAFAFDEAGDIWYTVLTETGGALCRATHDEWGASTQQVVTQMDGRPLGCLTAVAAGADGVYFAEAAGFSLGTVEDTLRAELMGHTATGWVYVYDPAGRSVQRVLGGLAGASGLALSPEGDTLYAADLGSRCIWAVDPAARERTAGGKGCALFAGQLPGYPGALAAGADGTVYAAYRWAEADWLESRAAQPGLRGVAARLPRSLQRGLFGSGEPLAQGYAPDGQLEEDYAGAAAGRALAVSGNRLYLPGDGENVVYFVF